MTTSVLVLASLPLIVGVGRDGAAWSTLDREAIIALSSCRGRAVITIAEGVPAAGAAEAWIVIVLCYAAPTAEILRTESYEAPRRVPPPCAVTAVGGCRPIL